MKFSKICLFLLGALFFSCQDNSSLVTKLKRINKNLQQQYAPDKRVAIYNITCEKSGDKIIIKGETDSKQAYQRLLDTLKNSNAYIVNKVRVLPDTAVGNKRFAVAKNSVINLRSKPKHASELSTQALLGMNLRVLDKKGDFYRVQTPEHYISWVDKGGIQLMNKKELDAWNASKKILFIKNFGYVYADKNEKSVIISDIVLGSVVAYVLETPYFYKIKYPDNRTGFLKKQEAVEYDSWLKKLTPTQKNIEKIAKNFIGFPYLWGGTSSKAMDCSGFTKMVYLLNGFIIPRDASQQINAGKIIDKNLKFKGLEKGDLLFFGTKAINGKKQHATHVGIWLGNNKSEFIHSSGNVHISSIDKNQPNYDEFNKNRYLGSRRYLGIKDKNIINLKNKVKLLKTPKNYEILKEITTKK